MEPTVAVAVGDEVIEMALELVAEAYLFTGVIPTEPIDE
jgi:hypothetical protein